MSRPSTRPIATWNPARGVWETDRASMFCGHWEQYSATWPTSGMTRSGTAYALLTSAPAMNDSGSSSLPSIQAPMSSTCSVVLLPTPRATDGEKGGPNQRGSIKSPLLPSAVARLLPTPTTSDGHGSGGHGTGGPDLRTTVASLLPTPQARDGQNRTLPATAIAHGRMGEGRRNLDDAVALLPTCRARDGKGRDPNPRGVDLNEALARLLPTPTAADADRASTTFPRGNPTLWGALIADPPPPASSTGASTRSPSDAGNISSAESHQYPELPDLAAD